MILLCLNSILLPPPHTAPCSFRARTRFLSSPAINVLWSLRRGMNRESAFVDREDVCRDTNYRWLTISFTFHFSHGGFRQDEWLSCLLLTLRLCRVIRRDFKGTNTTPCPSRHLQGVGVRFGRLWRVSWRQQGCYRPSGSPISPHCRKETNV